MAAELSDSDEEEGFETLDEPSSVTIGNGGYSINGNTTEVENDNVFAQKTESLAILGRKEKEVEASTDASTLNGGVTQTFKWSQSKDEVVVHVPLPDETRSRDLSIKCTDEVGKMTSTQLLTIYHGQDLILQGTFMHEVVLNKTKSDDSTFVEDPVDWEILDGSPFPQTNETKYMVITVRKKAIIANAIRWWSQVFVEDETSIDVTQIEERISASNDAKGNKQKATNEKWSSAWEEAHKLFREKVKSGEIKKTPVDI